MNINNALGLTENKHLFLNHNFWKEASSQLEQIVLLGRLGQYQEADFCFQTYLRDHLDQFSAVLEYADFLLEQRSYGQLGQFSHDRLTHYHFGPTENQLLDLSVRLSDLYLHGSRRDALATARLFWKSVTSQISGEPERMSNTLVSMLYTYDQGSQS
jgi:hypothetical protein